MTISGGNCSCANDYYVSGSTCTLCSDGYYSTDSTTCKICYHPIYPITCKRCSGPEIGRCTRCVSSTGYIKDGVCQTSCEVGTVSDNNGSTCSPCLDSNCKTCTDSLSTGKCTLCKDDFELVAFTCNPCPSGQFSTGTTCQSCGDANCLTCTGTVNKCTSCATNWLLIDGKCLFDCGSGKY